MNSIISAISIGINAIQALTIISLIYVIADYSHKFRPKTDFHFEYGDSDDDPITVRIKHGRLEKQNYELESVIVYWKHNNGIISYSVKDKIPETFVTKDRMSFQGRRTKLNFVITPKYENNGDFELSLKVPNYKYMEKIYNPNIIIKIFEWYDNLFKTKEQRNMINCSIGLIYKLDTFPYKTKIIIRVRHRNTIYL